MSALLEKAIKLSLSQLESADRFSATQNNGQLLVCQRFLLSVCYRLQREKSQLVVKIYHLKFR